MGRKVGRECCCLSSFSLLLNFLDISSLLCTIFLGFHPQKIDKKFPIIFNKAGAFLLNLSDFLKKF